MNTAIEYNVEEIDWEDTPRPGPLSTSIPLRASTTNLVESSIVTGTISRIFKRRRNSLDNLGVSQYSINNPRKSSRLTFATPARAIEYAVKNELEQARFVSITSEVEIERCELRLEKLVKYTKTGKPKKLSKAKREEAEELGKQLAYHRKLLQEATVKINEEQLKNRSLEASKQHAEAQLQSAAVAIVAANEEKNRTIQQANVFASATVAEAGKHVGAAQSDNIQLRKRIDTLLQEANEQKTQLAEAKKQFDEIVQDRIVLARNRDQELAKKNLELQTLAGKLQESQGEVVDYKAQLKSCQDLLDQCNGRLGNLTSEVDRLTKTNTAEAERFHREIYRLTGELTGSDDLKGRLFRVESELQAKTQELNLAHDNLLALQNQSSISDNQQATLIASLRDELRTAKDSHARNLTSHADTVNNLKGQIQDKDTEISRLRNLANQVDLLELNSLRKQNADNLKLISDLRATPTVGAAGSSVMASDLSELVAIPLREKIPHFSGYLGEQRVQDWFVIAERVAKGANWTKEQMKRYFCERFNNLAHAFQEKLDETSSPHRNLGYDDWKKLIIKEFKDPSEAEAFKTELSITKQRDQERVRDFAARLEKIFVKGYGEDTLKSTNKELTAMRDNILIKAFENGIKEDLAMGYWNRIFTGASYEDAVKVATEVENVVSKKVSTKSQSAANISAISLHQELLTTELETLKGRVNELTVSTSSQEKQAQGGGIPIVSTTNSSPRNSQQFDKQRANVVHRRVHSQPYSPGRGRGVSNNWERSRSPFSERKSRGNTPDRGRSPYRSAGYSSGNYIDRSSDRGSSRESTRRKPLRCFKCNKVGHRKAECRSGTNPRDRSRGRSPRR
jgi:hypothetical protein